MLKSHIYNIRSVQKDLPNFEVKPKYIRKKPYKVSKICFRRIKVYIIIPNIVFFSWFLKV